MPDPTLLADLERHAELVTELWSSGRERADVLAAQGLDEAAFEALDARVQGALALGMDEEGDDVPEILVAYDAALARARERRVDEASVPSLERFGAATAALERGVEPDKALARVGLTVTEYLRANAFWTPRVSKDPELHAAFQRARAKAR